MYISVIIFDRKFIQIGRKKSINGKLECVSVQKY